MSFPNGTRYPPPTYETCSDGISERCPAELSLYGDTFTLGACVFFVVAHALALLPQLYFGIKAKTWSYMVWLAIGTLFELIGYSGRIVMSSNPWVYNAFVIQLVLLILGPTLVAAAISITFKHLVLWYGREYSFIKPVLYPWVFVGTDFFSIVIQAAGGGISSAATDGDNNNQDLLDVGSGLLVAGVVFQMANMIFCGGLMMIYVWRRHKAIKNGAAVRAGDETAESESSSGRNPKVIRASDQKTKMFVFALAVAYVAIIIRCIYRIPEMQMGWGSTLMQNETTFLILDGAMILIAVWTLTIFHPYFFFPYMGKSHKKEMKDAEKSGAQQREAAPVMEDTGAQR
ncbi:hypothetical protein F53441_3698 [Fusarium austroafricanum]|uniref:RTA1-like protein n=1 Tax=Fusarium austroafricanum TaxID=2364996 RepID=A0A8H4NWF2_9HYPO|nr:hypothetical protein F53441_3698 [Fusarium austroafricanum]